MGWQHNPYAPPTKPLNSTVYRFWLNVVNLAAGYNMHSQRRIAGTKLSCIHRRGMYSRDWWVRYAMNDVRVQRLIWCCGVNADEVALSAALWQIITTPTGARRFRKLHHLYFPEHKCSGLGTSGTNGPSTKGSYT